MEQLLKHARPFFVLMAILLTVPVLRADSLWLGNNHETNALNVNANVYNMSTNGAIMGEVDAIAVTGIAWDGSNLFFSDHTGYFTKRSADGQTVLDTFVIPSTTLGEDLAYDSKRQVFWRVAHKPPTLEQIDPNSHLLLRVFAFPQDDSL